MSERWLPVIGYEGQYEVSDLGRVRGIGRYVAAKSGSRRWQSGVVLSPGRRKSGHVSVRLTRNAVGTSYGVHRLVLKAFVGPAPEGMECCHGNGMHADNRLVNLRWDTRSANAIDAVIHGTNANKRKTHCIHNHALTEDNLYRYGRKRKCKTCTANVAAARYAAQRKVFA